MKKITNFLMVAVTVLSFVSCTQEEVDPRDEFVGEYAFTQMANVAYDTGSSRKSFPLNINPQGTMYCVKVGTGNQVRLSGDILATMEGTVSGNTLVLSPINLVENEDGYTIQLTFNYKPVVKTGRSMTINATITGSVTIQGITVPLSGGMQLEAYKK